MHVRPEVEKLAHLTPAATGTEVMPRSEEMIHVSPATKRVAFAYERFRNTLEPDEEDILRRKAIFRILERRLAEDRPPKVAAEQLLQELIRANYIPPVTRRFAEHVAGRLERIKRLLPNFDTPIRTWLLHLMAVTIDRDIFPRQQEEALVQLMYHDTLARIEWLDDLIEPAERNTQVYMAAHRALFESDNYEIAYHYVAHHFPSWNTTQTSAADDERLIRELPAFYASIQTSLYHPARDRLSRLLRPAAVPYRILRDLLSKPEKLTAAETLKTATREAVVERAHKIRARMNRRAWHSILFLFLTKTVLALLIEVPYELISPHGFHPGALLTNIVFHPLLLFLLATTTRLPGASNTDRIVEEVEKIVTNDSPLPTIIVRQPRHYGAATWTFFALIYAVLFLLLFWGLFSLLAVLNFSLVAMFMFVMFLGLVSFLAIRIRRSVDDIRMIPRRETALGTLVTFLSLPILEFGRWLTVHITQLNVALFFMDRVLEAPFKILIDVTEEWFTFVRERREELV